MAIIKAGLEILYYLIITLFRIKKKKR